MRFDYIPVTPGGELGTIQSCMRDAVSLLLSAASTIPDPQDSNFNKTSSIKSALVNRVKGLEGWIFDFVGLEGVPFSGPKRNYVVDLAHDCQPQKGASRCRLLVEICFDNRQAIGTNILKLEAASSNFTKLVGGSALAVIICGDRRLLEAGNWDGGVGDEEEYQVAITKAYKGLLNSNFGLIIARA